MQKVNKVYVIGIGYRPLNTRARELILNSEVILSSKRLYEVFQRYAEFDEVKDRVRVINKVDETISFLHTSLITHHSSLPLILLASGDPLFFGIGRKALEEFGHDKVEILPDLSSIQVAFAAIGEPWDNAFLMSLHGGPDPEKRRRLPYELKDIPALLEQHNKIAVLTDKENNPSVIARKLASAVSRQPSAVRIFVCERLGYPDERVSSGTPEEIAGMSFGDPNVVILTGSPLNTPLTQPSPGGEGKAHFSAARFGLSEDEIVHSRGLITKDEVRAVSIHKLGLPQKGVFWDIGAGSGSVSIETARLYPELKIYSIEKNEEQIGNIKVNAARFRVSNVSVITGEAPSALTGLPDPDRVFIGGSSGNMSGIVNHISRTMSKGAVVINATTLETLSEAMKALSENGFETDVSEISVSRSKKIGDKRHMSALNPVFIIKGEKK
ncbi:MAG: precorrin-6y C5,15-methyltransferase (decarboxylating) subunit CbiE [Nitrospirae bacterium]|nr:precorrin-6y C5,15-methyltransferase (decarboxylating) subunit CbiE [Nitrospirota bacterium]